MDSRSIVVSFVVLVFTILPAGAQVSDVVVSRYEPIARRLMETGLRNPQAYEMLERLTSEAPRRLSGSSDAAKAVELTKRMMHDLKFDNVHLELIKVPHWVRGPVERGTAIVPNGKKSPLTICALGGSIATPKGGITAEVVEVKSFEELQALGPKAKGKIIFYNRPFDASEFNTFEAYGGAVDQRSKGAVEAARVGGVAALVRSMTLALDDVPHTGMMGYVDSVAKVPAAAVSTMDANMLSEMLKKGQKVRVKLELSCETLPDVESANVVGEITGSEFPNEVIVVGGHLDCWDKGSGAHDDGAGCVQAIEALRLIKELGLKPKRTIRAVMFMNEENGLRGGKAYPVAPERQGEKHIAALESDRGGFAPRGITIAADSVVVRRVQSWRPLFEILSAGQLDPGYGGVDISPLMDRGIPGFGLHPEGHRYFDYHHSANDTIDKVNARELEMGAVVEALFCYIVAQEGL